MPRRRMNYKKRALAPRPVRRRRRVARKKRIVRIQRRVINNQGFGFPPTKVIPMRYAETISLSGSAGAMATYTFRANSIYDPNYTGTGSQPISHDQWSAFYGRYTVIGAKIRVYNNDTYATGTALPFLFGVQVNSDLASVTNDYVLLVQQGRDKFQIHNSNYDKSRSVRKGFSLKKFFNLANVKDNMTTHGAHFGSNPTEIAYFTLWAQDQAKSAAINANMFVIIDYMVLLSEPLNLPAS